MVVLYHILATPSILIRNLLSGHRMLLAKAKLVTKKDLPLWYAEPSGHG